MFYMFIMFIERGAPGIVVARRHIHGAEQQHALFETSCSRAMRLGMHVRRWHVALMTGAGGLLLS